MRRTLLALCSLSLFLVPADLLAQKKDPLATFLFALKVDIVGIGETTAFFKSVGGLGSETEVVEFREGGATGFVRKLIGVDQVAQHRAEARVHGRHDAPEVENADRAWSARPGAPESNAHPSR